MSISQINNYESKVQPVLRPALSYSNRNLDNTTDSGGGSADKKDDNKNLMYIGAGIAGLGIIFLMNKKGR
ncbi:hypothetical protein LEP1GSC082_3941 [Leptospira kirschneri str. H2]|nr:hypothetical protein LEP1GSC082_3941 [Leptospira kirschneri str. H2]